MNTTIIGFPRIGENRELKHTIEKYWKNLITKEDLLTKAKELRNQYWKKQKDSGLSDIPSNDFSLYDNMLDTIVMLNAIPKKYQELDLSRVDTYFAMARGYQGEKGDVTALTMKKWFNTNYHYMVPELDDDTEISFDGKKLFDEYDEALEANIETRPVIIGPLTFLKLANLTGQKKREEYIDSLIKAYQVLVEQCNQREIEWIQIDEPILVTDLTEEDLQWFEKIYKGLLQAKGTVKILLQTYFGDVRDCYDILMSMSFDGIGLDFVEGKQTLELIENKGFSTDKELYAGVVNGKNIWKCDYSKAIKTLKVLDKLVNSCVISTSCSLLHSPYTVKSEKKLSQDILEHFSFAYEKLNEIYELSELIENVDYEKEALFLNNREVINKKREMLDPTVQDRVNQLKEADFIRQGKRTERQLLQKTLISNKILPTTTIGSFPQTKEVKRNRSLYRKGELSKTEYDKNIFKMIEEVIKLQEDIGLDVLVHGEYERNDMVEYFGENLIGYVFTEKGWVQSYGTRCVKPPIIYGDIKRSNQISVEYSSYAKSLTSKPVKGMLTGPVTILNWSFPREDITLKEMAYQIGLAIREEVLDLEKAGISIIQIDEAALREKLPIRKVDWEHDYLDWAIKSFCLCHSGVKQETQIHTHMCYSEFEDIIEAIDNMDADVITFEASRSKLTLLDSIYENDFETEVGPGVYDIHSPRVPPVEEIVEVLRLMIKKIGVEKLWVNPDCGLKTRGVEETIKSLKNMIEATNIVREELECEN